MDQKDERITDVLQENSRLSMREISRKTHIPITTVHKRIKRLTEEGIIEKFSIKLNHKKIGKLFSAVILVTADYKLLREIKKDQRQLAKELSYLPEIEKVDVVTGGTDMVIKVRVSNVDEFDDFLFKKVQKIPGVDHTETLVVIHEC